MPAQHISKDKLARYLADNTTLNNQELESALSSFQHVILESGEDFLKAGKISERIAFVNEGILRVYIVDKDAEEIIKYFIKENQFTVCLESYSTNTPSPDTIQAVTRCELLTISKQAMDIMENTIPQWAYLVKSLTEIALLEKIRSQNFLRIGSAAQKYQTFLEDNPDISLRVPLQYIASYLGITPQSLSRIRKNHT